MTLKLNITHACYIILNNIAILVSLTITLFAQAPTYYPVPGEGGIAPPPPSGALRTV